MTPFAFQTAGKILFGRGQADQAHVLVRDYGRRVLLVRGRSVSWVDGFAERLTAAGAEVGVAACHGEPALADVERVVSLGREHAADVVVAVGGGAVIDLGKAAAALIPARSDAMDHLEVVGKGLPLPSDPLPFVAIPTTAGTGAEVTKNAVISVPEAGRKVSLRDPRMLPDLAIVDPALTDGAPLSVTLASGLDAVTQVVEPYLSSRANPLTDALCRAAIPMGVAALARLTECEDRGARDRMAYVSLTGGIALANAGLGAVHGLAGVIGGRTGAPHGLICGRLLGPVLSANRQRAGDAGVDLTRYEEIKAAFRDHFGLRGGDPFELLSSRLDDLRLPRLGEWLSRAPDLSAIAEEAKESSSMKGNPFELDSDTLLAIMKKAM
ncbi:iron-containing alcohol dehydrogenase [Ostreiculturibacter nitratireducens]|uniref:iron-containing alcohol dehydrogenase n=1 Tax=Ostreiculturibacter nitratireducens TaxID=3075226 RepID=UPI0031B57CA0